MGGRRFKVRHDYLLNTIPVFQNFVVPESQKHEPLCLQPSRSGSIGLLLGSVLPPIELNNQTPLQANEIHDEGPKFKLASELLTGKPTMANALPNKALRIGHVFAKISRTFVGHGFDPPPQPCPARGEGEERRLKSLL